MQIGGIARKIINLMPRYALEKAQRMAAWPILQPFIPALGRIVRGRGRISSGVGEGLLFDATESRIAYLLGTYCSEEQSLLADCISSGDIFYDVGAHVGFYSVVGARLVGEEGKVVAFEPVPEIAKKCKYNLKQNGFHNAVVVEAAVGEKKGVMKFKVDSESQASKLSETGNIEVKVICLDEWIERGEEPGPDVILIDAEGNEVEVLKGAMKTIKESRPTILVEVHGIGDRFSKFIDSCLKPIGYTARRLSGGSIPASSGVDYRAIIRPKGHIK
jgi:FkbM family methyltransferase